MDGGKGAILQPPKQNCHDESRLVDAMDVFHEGVKKNIEIISNY